MADIAASVLTRLKNKAQASGRSYQLCLQLFCQEEFLRRLEKSKYAENFVLKGGLFIYSLDELIKNCNIVATKYKQVVGILYNGIDVRVFKNNKQDLNEALDG